MRRRHTIWDLSLPRVALLAVPVLLHLWAPRLAAQNFNQLIDWTPEVRETIWKQQAEETADNLEISGDDKSKLTALYLASRKTLQEQMDALAENVQSGQSPYEEYRRLAGIERDTFKTALADFLEDGQVEAVSASLGSFSRQWDRLLFAWGELVLDPEKGRQGRRMIAAYIADWEKLRNASPPNGDVEFQRDELDRLKISLDLSLATLLSEEQQNQWQRRSQFGGLQRGRPGRRSR